MVSDYNTGLPSAVVEEPAPSSSGATELVLMGTGTSVGVPVVGCPCEVCTSTNLKNHRLRAGVLVRAPLGEFVIDTGPELRIQLVRNGATTIRAALFTHAHADHIMGLDDLRIFAFRLEREALQEARKAATDSGQEFDEERFQQQPLPTIPLFCEEAVEQSLRHVFSYAFTDPSLHTHRFAAPRLSFVRIQPGVPFSLLGTEVLPIRLQHGQLPILGFRIGDVGFCTDVSSIPSESRDLLQGLKTLVIDALRYEPHPTHLSVEQAVRWAERLGAEQTVLTHMSHELNYDTLAAELPVGIVPGYDGLKIPVNSSNLS
ncbi:MAG: MBL fold metallo-hydrolase [Planctomycetaceae bacterium]